MTQATWESLIGANLRAPLFLSQAAAPHLKKTSGVIVNITDIHAERPLKSYVIYSIAKAGLAGLTRSLARELGPEVRVNGVAPGPIAWPEDGSFDEVARQRVISNTILRRTGDPDDVARAVYYLIAVCDGADHRGGRRPEHQSVGKRPAPGTRRDGQCLRWFRQQEKKPSDEPHPASSRWP
jgi:NAD(P)-dependent dehydrogenase (short-subunit alcohol dehydrogenase family)